MGIYKNWADRSTIGMGYGRIYLWTLSVYLLCVDTAPYIAFTIFTNNFNCSLMLSQLLRHAVSVTTESASHVW